MQYAQTKPESGKERRIAESDFLKNNLQFSNMESRHDQV